MSVKIDGIRMRLKAVDVDKDGKTGSIESVSSHKDEGIMSIKETSELGEALSLQNQDTENDQRLSSVDFVSRIHSFQHAPLVAVDTIASMGVISSESRMVVKNIMRKAVSLEGKGRQEFVDVVTGKTERDIARKSVGNLSPEGQKGR